MADGAAPEGNISAATIQDPGWATVVNPVEIGVPAEDKAFAFQASNVLPFSVSVPTPYRVVEPFIVFACGRCYSSHKRIQSASL